MYRGFTRSEAVGLVCNLSSKLLKGIFSGHAVQFFLQPPCLEPYDDEFSRYIVVINVYVLCCFSWRREAVKFHLSYSTGAEPKTVEEERKAVYQIRRPLGLVFVISFGVWETCCHSIFRRTQTCPSLSQSPDLLVFPATYTPPPTH
jgi:hypothetical protein